MKFLLRLLPASFIRAVGRLQFKYPFLGRIINKVGQGLAGEGIIQRGAGKGLYFDARGCNPGYLAGTTEPLEQEMLLRYALPGGVVYDLGANAGYYAVIAARAVGADGQVFAFEPTPKLAERIRTNASRNNLTNLEVVEAAVSDADGEINFGIVGELSVSNSIRAAEDSGGLCVKAVRLDTFSVDKKLPTLMLIDIEGAEIAALEGVLDTIRKSRPVIMVEVHWLGAAFPEFVETALKPLGYSAATFDGDPLPTGNDRYHALLLPSGPPAPQ